MPNLSHLRKYGLYNTPVQVSNDAHDLSHGVFDPEYMAMLYPVDERSGFPSSDLARVLSDSVSSAEKERIISRLQRQDGKFLPADISDADVFALVPPRFMLGDQVSVQKWRDYLASDVLPYMADELKSVDLTPEPNSPNVEPSNTNDHE